MKRAPNPLPKPATLAKRFAMGRYCDYPAVDVVEAVNSHDLEYNSITIPLPSLGLRQTLSNLVDEFHYLCTCCDGRGRSAFLKDPEGFLKRRGFNSIVPVSADLAYVIAALSEPEMRPYVLGDESFRSDDCALQPAVRRWYLRHDRRFENLDTDTYYGFGFETIMDFTADDFKFGENFVFNIRDFCRLFEGREDKNIQVTYELQEVLSSIKRNKN